MERVDCKAAEPSSAPFQALGMRKPNTGIVDNLNQGILTDQVVLVIGGKARSGTSAYQSIDDTDAFFGTSNASNPDGYNANVDMRHVVDYFLTADIDSAGAQVYHVPAIDARESAVEARSAANRTGLLQPVSEAELCERAAGIFKEPTYRDADIIVMNYDIAVPFPDDVPLATYTAYLSGRMQRALSAVSVIGQSWSQSLSGTDSKTRQVIVLMNNILARALILAYLRVIGGEMPTDEQAMKAKSDEFKTAHGIDLFFVKPEVTQQDHDELDLDERKWRSAVNTFVQHGHKQSITRDIGLKVVTRVASQCHGSVMNYNDELRDRILLEFSFSTRSIKPGRIQRIDVFGRSKLFPYVNSLEQWRGQDSRHEDDEHSIAFAGFHILILDSGRGDGLTAALCKRFYNLGARVAFTYDSNRSNGIENADLILSSCQDGPGFVVKVEGIPYRAKHQEEPSDVPCAEDMIVATLKALDTETIDCMVNNAGWSYSLTPLQSERERMRLIKRDSRRNLLALGLFVCYMTRAKNWGKHPHIVNIAGLACNPAMELCGSDDWTVTNKFMRFWFHLFRNPKTRANFIDDANLAISTIVPGSIMDSAIRPSSQAKSLAWQARLVEMYERWIDQTYIEETATIVRLLADDCNADQAGEFIVPEDGPMSTQHYAESDAAADDQDSQGISDSFTVPQSRSRTRKQKVRQRSMNKTPMSGFRLRQLVALNKTVADFAKRKMDEMRDQIECTKQQQQQECPDAELSEREGSSSDEAPISQSTGSSRKRTKSEGEVLQQSSSPLSPVGGIDEESTSPRLSPVKETDQE